MAMSFADEKKFLKVSAEEMSTRDELSSSTLASHSLVLPNTLLGVPYFTQISMWDFVLAVKVIGLNTGTTQVRRCKSKVKTKIKSSRCLVPCLDGLTFFFFFFFRRKCQDVQMF